MNTDALILGLVNDLRPVRPLQPPGLRALAWLVLVLLAAALLLELSGRQELVHRLLQAPDMWLAVVGSVLTTVTAAIATFMVSLPDRSSRWALLPVPPLLLWLGANGAGCLRNGLPGLETLNLSQSAGECLPFIVVTSIPLAVAMTLMLRRATTLRPELTAVTAGLAVASAAASLLWIIHRFDAGLSDLLVHIGAVALVVLLQRLFATPFLMIRPRLVS